MDVIEAYAKLSVACGCGFALLAIGCVMVGLLESPVLALKVGGIFCSFVAIVLMLKFDLAQRMNYKNTEVWLMLKVTERPPADIAQRLISNTLSRIFAEFGLYFARGAASALGAVFIMEPALQ
jgi:hypothetical protein